MLDGICIHKRMFNSSNHHLYYQNYLYTPVSSAYIIQYFNYDITM